MIGLSNVLVVDSAKPSRETLCSVLSAHCERVIEAATLAEALAIAEAERELSLVLCEAALEDGDAGDLIAEIASRSQGGTAVVVVASRPREEEGKRVLQLGAIAYLAKPISFIDLSRVLKRSRKPLPEVARRVHRKPLGTALVLDESQPGDSRREVASHVLWDILDISQSGAFLETRGPVPVGRELALGIVLGGRMLRVTARVMRMQEPSWDHPAGIGVAFTHFEDGAEDEIAGFIHAYASS